MNRQQKTVLALGCYRAAALGLFLCIEGGLPLNGYQRSIFVFLCMITGLYISLCFFSPKKLSYFLAPDYLAVLLYAYYEPHVLWVEMLLLPPLFMNAAFCLPRKARLLIVPALGSAAAFLSYSFLDRWKLEAGSWSAPFYLFSFFFYMPASLAALLASRSYFNMIDDRKRLVELEQTNSHLNEINRAISGKLFNIEQDSVRFERSRLSKEIHDIAGYVFVNLIMMLQAALAVFHKDSGKAEGLIADARDYAERGINEIRHTLRNIRGQDAASLGLQNDMYNIAEVFRKATGCEVSLQYGQWPRSFSPELDGFFKSFLQEALTNAMKHGRADVISVYCSSDSRTVSMSVKDNGRGAEFPIHRGIGISSLEDMASQYGGGVDISGAEAGFSITVWTPLGQGNRLKKP
jgi:signal transduction histidine kinase